MQQSPSRIVQQWTTTIEVVAWLIFCAFGVVALVACVVLPKGSRHERTPESPWFWMVFPVTCLMIAASVGVFMAWPQAMSSSGSLWWDLSGPRTPTGQFLSSEQYHEITVWNRMRWLLPVASVVGIGLSVWAWRRGRV
uniref:Uncharacterized protein n=1 Tax=Rhodococcus sp. NS1 TaxID=402236 RepID=A0A097SPR0_9NOCA|nr:hypothetical protein LRS1606.75 [Rhodococcus sp. NS1]